MKNEQSTQAINIFWNWFRDNISELANLPNLQAERQAMQLYWLNNHLKGYCTSIDLVLVFAKYKANPQLIFTTTDEDTTQMAVTLIKNAPKKTKWTIHLKYLQPSKSSGFVIIKEPVLSRELPTKNYSNIKSEKHLLVHLPKRNIYCHYKHLDYISKMTDTPNPSEDVPTFVQVPCKMQRTKTAVELFEFQFFIDEINRKTNTTV